MVHHGLRKPPVPAGAARAAKKVLKTLHREVDWSVIEVGLDPIGVLYIHMLLSPSTHAVVTNYERMWTLKYGKFALDEPLDDNSPNWTPIPGLLSDSPKEVTTYVLHEVAAWLLDDVVKREYADTADLEWLLTQFNALRDKGWWADR